MVFRRLHIDARLLVEQGAADAVPVEPAAEIALGQTLLRNDVLNDHRRRVEAAQAGGAGAQSPLAHLLPEQGSSLAPDAVIPEARAREAVATEGQIDP